MATTRRWPGSNWSDAGGDGAGYDEQVTLFDPPVGEVPPPDPASAVRVRATVAYQGSGFRGFAAQPGQRTVAGVLNEALERVLRHPVAMICAGRTDAGVHAWGQVISFDAAREVGGEKLDLAAVQRSVNKQLKAEVVIRDIAIAPADFDARRSATARIYRYTILNRGEPDPFLAETTWQVEAPLDLHALQLACDPLIGEHDFSSFCRKPPDPDAVMVRRLRRADWTVHGGDLFRFEVEASAFCHQMVRSLVGTMVDVGTGRKKAGEMAGILRARDRALTSGPAPPHGLCLWEVLFE
jgi:tRNA pseudouridine38-40 synthase